MQQKPRKMTDTFLNWKKLGISFVQGLAIPLGVLFAYQHTVQNGGNEEQTRAMVFTALIFANILLSLVNHSFYYSILESLKNRNILFVAVNGITIILLFAILYIESSGFFHLTELNVANLDSALSITSVSVL